MADLTGKVALITGAARGQGRAHALALAAAGADIIATDVCKPIASAPYELATPDDLAETAAEVERLGRRVVSRECNIRSSSDLQAAVAAGLDQFGKIDMTHYVAAKHGVLGLMRNAALELGPYNIRCNAVALPVDGGHAILPGSNPEPVREF